MAYPPDAISVYCTVVTVHDECKEIPTSVASPLSAETLPGCAGLKVRLTVKLRLSTCKTSLAQKFQVCLAHQEYPLSHSLRSE